MRGVVLGEYSQRITREFRLLGHEFFSCDIKEEPEINSDWHIKGSWHDVMHYGWDFAILHTECTAVAVSGNRFYARGKEKYQERLRVKEETPATWEALKKAVPKAVLEQPINVLDQKRMGKKQVIQPWFFGVPAFKATCLYLHNVEELQDTNRLDPPRPGTREFNNWSKVHFASPGPDRWKFRSRTEPYIAKAMAEQWGRQ